jgi:DNA-directed RNA polymerase subunit RPC12/RpoP
MGMIVALVVQNLLKFYYPFFIEKRLKVLRYRPRISPKTGKAMKLLSEDEEDAYLDEGMQAEENVFSIDYDVWKDEETGYVKIEKYSGHLHALQCPECNYQTFKVVREEILKAPTQTEEGELAKHYQCGYCGYKAKKNVTLRMSQKFEESTAATA